MPAGMMTERATARQLQRDPDPVAQHLAPETQTSLAALSARMAARSRQRRHRERLRSGKIVIPIEIGEASLGLLIDAGYLHPHVADEPKQIAKALETMLRSIQRHA
jgi:hypothetical protein